MRISILFKLLSATLLNLAVLVLPPLLLGVVPAAAQNKPRIEVVPIIPHALAVTSVAFSADGKLLVSAGNDKIVSLWDVASSRLVRTFEGHTLGILAVALSPDGHRMVSGGRDKLAQIWDLSNGQSVFILKGHEGLITSLAYSTDGKRIASASADRTIKIWDAASGALLQTLEGHTDTVSSVAFTPDGKRLLSGSVDLTLKLWDLENGVVVRTYWGHAGEVNTVAVSTDGRLFVSGGDDKVLRTWDPDSWAQTGIYIGHSDIITSVAFSHDGTQLVSGSKDTTARLWNVASAKAIKTLNGHTGRVGSVTISPDGSRIVTGGGDRTVRIWELPGAVQLSRFEGPAERTNAVAYTPDGKFIVTGGGDARVRLWDGVTGELLRTFRGHTGLINGIDVSPDGKRIASSSIDKSVRVWDTATGLLEQKFDSYNAIVSSVSFFPDGTQIAAGYVDHAIRIFDIPAGTLVRACTGHSSEVNSVDVSSDGTRILSGSDDLTLQLWDAADCKSLRIYRGHKELISSVRFSPDGRRMASASWDGTVKLWDASSETPIHTLSRSECRVTSVSFADTGDRLITGCGDGNVRLWDVTTGTLTRTFEGHRGWVSSVAFAATGKHFVSGGNDGTVKLWHEDDAHFLASLMGGRDGQWLVTTPEGFINASPDAGSMASIVRGFDIFEIAQAYQALFRPDLVQQKIAGDPEGKVRKASETRDLEKLLDSGHVPKVRFVSASSNASDSDKDTIEVSIADLGGGIGKVEWRIDGVTDRVDLPDTNDGPGAKSKSLQHIFTLDPGENVVEVVAYNRQNLVSSAPAVLKRTWNGKQTTTPPRLHVLAVGINKYWDSKLRLNYAVPDAKSLGEALQSAGKDQYKDVSITYAIDEEATVSGLDQIFKRLHNQVRKRDVFVFFVAAHGKTEDGKYFLVPQDFKFVPGKPLSQSLARNAISQDQLQKWLSSIKAKKNVVIFDTCESGSLTVSGEVAALGQSRGGFELSGALNRLVQATGRTTLTAALDDQPAREGYGNHGVFTFAILDALARGDRNSNGTIEVTELIDHVDNLVPELTEKKWRVRQVPRSLFQGSNFALGLQTAGIAPSKEQIIPVKPTHVIIESVDVLTAAGGTGATAVQSIPRGTLVTQLKSEADWSFIAMDGRALGFVTTAKLLQLAQ